MMLLASIGATAQNVQENSTIITSSNSAGRISSEFSSDGKGKLVTSQYTDNIRTFQIYDEDLDCIKTFNIKVVPYEDDVVDTYVIDTNSLYDGEAQPLTQTLFNNDEKYEYIMTIVDPATSNIKGFKIINDENTVLQEIIIEDYNNLYMDIDVIKIGDKYYLRASIDDDTYAFYAINKETSSVKKVNTLKGIRINPSITKRNTPVTIDLGDETDSAHNIIVSNAEGKTLHRMTVPAGHKQVTLDTSRWGRGMNIITVKDAKSNRDSQKVIIK